MARLTRRDRLSSKLFPPATLVAAANPLSPKFVYRVLPFGRRRDTRREKLSSRLSPPMVVVGGSNTNGGNAAFALALLLAEEGRVNLQLRYKRIATVSNAAVTGGANAYSVLWTVNINTAVASAVLKIYDGQDATGTLVAQIDASAASSKAYGVLCKNGIFVDLSGGAADCTIGYL